MMAMVRVKIRASFENIEAGDYRIEKAQEGETIEFPRWVAEELAALNLVAADEEPFEVEVSRALSREKMMGPLQLSAMPPDFYVRMKRRVEKLGEGVKEGKNRSEDFQKFKNACYDLVGMRLSKLLSLSSASTTVKDSGANLAPEEKTFFTLAQSISKEWKSALLGETM